VGRLCTITIDNPIGNESAAPIGATSVRSDGHDLSFTLAPAQDITGNRYYGCFPPGATPTPFPYSRTVLTPDQPLPALAKIEVLDGTMVLLTVMTSDRLDRSNCEPPAHPHAGFCQPPLDLCLDGGPGPSLPVDASPLVDGQRADERAADAGAADALVPAAADAAISSVPDGAPALSNDAAVAPVADAAPAAKGSKSGCTLGSGRPGWLGAALLLFAAAILRRRRG
jgi:hypothetical protein